jgi:hypothetical protein
VSVSRSIFPLVDGRHREYFGFSRSKEDSIGFIDNMRALFGRTYAAEPDVLVRLHASREMPFRKRST